MTDSEKAEKIAALNDAYRKRGSLRLTEGITVRKDVDAIVAAVRNFDEFNKKNDPYHEHDFGMFEWPATRDMWGATIMWKIDYYDANLKYLGDATSPWCNRVLTVMLASEY